MRSPGSTPSIWRRLEALGDSEFNSAVSRVTNSSQAATLLEPHSASILNRLSCLTDLRYRENVSVS
jgi:hypothetical protein